MKILVIDDDLDVLKQSKIFLEKNCQDFEIVTEVSSEKAIELLESENFDAIVSDYKMPKLTGIDILKHMRGRGDDTPFIILTGKGREGVAMKALNLGADRYFQKGLDSSVLYEMVSNAILDEIDIRETEKELSKTRDIYVKIAKNLPNGLVNIVDRDLNILFSEGDEIKTLGYTHDDIIGLNVYDVIPKENADRFASNIKKALEGNTVKFEDSIDDLHFISNIVPLPEEDEQKVLILTVNISEKVEAEKRMREASRELSTLVDNLPGMVYRCENKKGWPMEMVKGEVEELTGYTASEIESDDGIWGEEIIHPEDRQKTWDVVQTSIRTKRSFEVIYRIVTKEGVTKWVWEQGTFVYEDDEEIKALEGFITDITEKRETQRKLEESMEKIKDLHRLSTKLESIDEEQDVYDLIVEATEDILNFDLCTVEIVEDNKLIVKASGSKGQLEFEKSFPMRGIAAKSYHSGKTIYSSDIPKDSEAAPDNEIYRSGITVPIGTIGVFQIISDKKDDFDEQDIELAELLISNATEALYRILNEKSLKENRRKITELYKVAEKLEKCHSKQKIYDIAMKTAKEILEFYHATIMIYEDGDLVIKRTNDEKLDTGVHLSIDEGYYGKTFKNKESYLVKNIRDSEEAKPQREEFLSAMSFPLGDFGVFQTISTKEGFYDEDDLEVGELLTSHIAEAIQRVEFEEDLKKNERRYRSLFEYSPISLWEEDFSAVKTYIDELKEEGIEDVKEYFVKHPEEIRKCAEMVRIIDVNESTLNIYGAESKDVFVDNLDEILAEEAYEIFKEQLYNIIDGVMEFHGEAENRTLDGGKIDIFMKWIVAKGHEEDYSRVLVSIIDITERKDVQRELKDYKDHLEELVEERTKQLEEMNEQLKSFTHSVSHDLRAPLRGLQGFSRALMEDYREILDETGKEYLERIKGASQRMEILIDDLLEYSRLSRTDIVCEKTDVNNILEIIKDELISDIGMKNADIFISDIPDVKGERTILKQVLTNLLSNALKFVDEKPKIEIYSEEDNDRIRIFVEDNGIGIKKEEQEKIFKVFERLHGIESYEGTGVGLAIVKKGVEKMGGRVKVESDLGEGSRFWIELDKA
ncbi:MAG: GAF domain-containing protein [Candidatus Saliniplasma sp.]